MLTRRIAYRIATGTADARHTLALTFTREAAGELRRRLRRPGLRDHVEAGTFHSVALGVLQQRWADPDRQRRRRRPTASGSSASSLDAVAPWPTWRPSSTGPRRAASPPTRTSSAARRGAAADAPPGGAIAEALGAYETLKRRRGVIDLDDLLLAARSAS